MGFLKTGLFVIIVLVSGSFAGLIYGGLNLALVEPFLDDATNIENQNLFESGEETDSSEFWVEYYSYRSWQKGGQILAATILGTSIGAVFGIVFAYSTSSFIKCKCCYCFNRVGLTLILSIKTFKS